MPVTAPADKRFRRAHIRPTRQTPWRRRWLRIGVTLGVLVLAVVGISGTVAYALSSKRLAIRRIDVNENTRISSGEVRAVLSDLIGRNVLTADIKTSQKKLKGLPWVAEAEIRRILPGAISVAVAERRAMAIARLGDELHLIDRVGYVIAEYGPDYAQFDLPIVDGLTPGGKLLVDPDRAEQVWRVLSALKTRADLASRIALIDVNDPDNVVLTLNGDSALIRVGTDHILERLSSYVEVASALHAQIPDIDYVDLRFKDGVVVRPLHVEHATRPRGGKG
jgi:cell division septal protein FtsQ